MIAYDYHGIMVHIPKTGGTSIFQFFCDMYGVGRVEGKKKIFNMGRYCDPNFDHNRAIDYTENNVVSQEIWEKFFKWSVVRDPVKRFVSFYTWMRGEPNGRTFANMMSLDEFVDIFEERLWNVEAGPGQPQGYNFVRPQHEFIIHDGQIMVDMILQTERLSSHFEHLRKTLNLPDGELGHVNKSGGRVKKTLKITQRQVEFVEKLYKEDFELHEKISGESPWFK